MKVTNTNTNTNVQKNQLVKPNDFGFGDDFKKGIHLGACHNPLTVTSPWNISSYNDLLGIAPKKPIINSLQTKKALLQAFHIIVSILKRKGYILIVNTENSAHFSNINQFVSSHEAEQMKQSTEFSDRNFIHLNHERIALCFEKWIPGTLTNFKQVSKSIFSYVKFAEIFKLTGSDTLDSSNEILNFPRYFATSHKYRGYVYSQSVYSSLNNKSLRIKYSDIDDNGVEKTKIFKHKFVNTVKDHKVDVKSKMSLPLNGRPDLVIILNPEKNRNVVAEANKLHIPVMALTSTKVHAKGIDYPILCNPSVDFNYYFLKKLIKLCSIYN